jgi:hypothetical protein
MGLLRNKRGIEGLPLKYLVIALVAALVIGIALQFVGALRGGTIGAAEQFNQTVGQRTACELDSTGPLVNAGWLCQNTNYSSCDTTANSGDVLNLYADVTDNEGGCGVDDFTGVFAYIHRNGVQLTSVSLRRQSGDIFSGTYTTNDTGTYYARIFANDNSTAENSQRLMNQTANVTVS